MAATWRRAGLVVVIITLSAFIAPLACRREPDASPAAPQAQTVTTTSPIQRELPRHLRVTGTLHGDEETTVAAKVAGRIIEVFKDMGDVALPGEPLMRIDPTDYELALAERQRAFYESLAKLGLSQMPAEGFDVAALPSVERARLQAENARARYERARVLFERDPPLISEQDFADLRTAWEVAQSNLEVERMTAESILAEARTVEAQVNVAEQRVRDCVHRAPEAAKLGIAQGLGFRDQGLDGRGQRSEVRGQRSEVRDQRSEVRGQSEGDRGGGETLTAHLQPPTSDHRLPAISNPQSLTSDPLSSSPRAYEVAARMVTVGDYVQIGSPLMRLVDSDPLKLRASVPERRLGSIKAGQPAIVRIEAFSQPFNGRVSRVSPAVDLQTRSFAVEILVSNPDRALKAGSFAAAQIEIARESALLVPETSVITFAGVHKVVIVQDNIAQEKRVELGDRVDGLIEIRSGISAADQVVNRPPSTLTSGTPVKVVSAAALQASRGEIETADERR